MLNRLRNLWQYCLPQQLLSSFMGSLATLSKPAWLKNTFIKWFIQHYKVDLSESVETDHTAFPHFQAFFTRALQPTVRDLTPRPQQLISPVDGFISQWGRLDQNRLLQAKGQHYTLETLLANDPIAPAFKGGEFMTLYLAPSNYHRVHMPIEGKLKKMLYVPGRLFSVNPSSTQGIPNLFARNERLICLFDTPTGSFAVIFVGAMIVGGISTTFQDSPQIKRSKGIKTWYYNLPCPLQQGQELGYFSLGSTVILLSTPNSLTWDKNLALDAVVQLGQPLATTVV